jgi:hypothetical protein
MSSVFLTPPTLCEKFFTPIRRQILTNLRPPSPLQNANVFYGRPYDYREDSYICITALVLNFFGKNHQTQRKLLFFLWKVIAIFSKLSLSDFWISYFHLIFFTISQCWTVDEIFTFGRIPDNLWLLVVGRILSSRI